MRARLRDLPEPLNSFAESKGTPIPPLIGKASRSPYPASLGFKLFELKTAWGGALIARIWTGATRRSDGDAYAEYMHSTGIQGYRNIPGNRAAVMLRRDVEERSEFIMLSLWDSMDSIAAFAGEDLERAVFYPEDDRFLIERDLTVAHYQVAEAEGAI